MIARTPNTQPGRRNVLQPFFCGARPYLRSPVLLTAMKSTAPSGEKVHPVAGCSWGKHYETRDLPYWFAPGLMEGRKLEKESLTCPSSTPMSSSSAL